jgi:hypothetical protein
LNTVKLGLWDNRSAIFACWQIQDKNNRYSEIAPGAGRGRGRASPKFYFLLCSPYRCLHQCRSREGFYHTRLAKAPPHHRLQTLPCNPQTYIAHLLVANKPSLRHRHAAADPAEKTTKAQETVREGRCLFPLSPSQPTSLKHERRRTTATEHNASSAQVLQHTKTLCPYPRNYTYYDE